MKDIFELELEEEEKSQVITKPIEEEEVEEEVISSSGKDIFQMELEEEEPIKEEAEKKLISKHEITEVVIRSTRHIITTSVTTIGGFAPLIFTSVFFRPLAWAMTIGVLGATLLALLYIPAMFMFMNKVKS